MGFFESLRALFSPPPDPPPSAGQARKPPVVLDLRTRIKLSSTRTPDFSGVRRVAPSALVALPKKSTASAFLFEGRIFVLCGTDLKVYRPDGSIELEMAVPRGVSVSHAVDRDRLMFQDRATSYVLTLSSRQWKAISLLGRLAALGWVGSQLLAFKSEDTGGHHSESYHHEEVAYLLDDQTWTLRKLSDQTMGGRLCVGGRKSAGDSLESARLGGRGLIYKARSPSGVTPQRSKPGTRPDFCFRGAPRYQPGSYLSSLASLSGSRAEL